MAARHGAVRFVARGPGQPARSVDGARPRSRTCKQWLRGLRCRRRWRVRHSVRQHDSAIPPSNNQKLPPECYALGTIAVCRPAETSCIQLLVAGCRLVLTACSTTCSFCLCLLPSTCCQLPAACCAARCMLHAACCQPPTDRLAAAVRQVHV